MISDEDRKLFEFYSRLTVEQRIERGFIRTYRPVLDDVPYRCFDTMADYKKWCNECLPAFLGMGTAKDL